MTEKTVWVVIYRMTFNLLAEVCETPEQLKRCLDSFGESKPIKIQEITIDD